LAEGQQLHQVGSQEICEDRSESVQIRQSNAKTQYSLQQQLKLSPNFASFKNAPIQGGPEVNERASHRTAGPVGIQARLCAHPKSKFFFEQTQFAATA
jgi:hypothetical protein